MNDMESVRPLGILCNHKQIIHAAIVGSVRARSLTRAHSVHVQSCTCPLDGFCIAPDTIAYAKVSGAVSIAWRTQLHLTGRPLYFVNISVTFVFCLYFFCLSDNSYFAILEEGL